MLKKIFSKIIQIDKNMSWRFCEIFGIRLGIRFSLGRYWKPSWMKLKFKKTSKFFFVDIYYDEEDGLTFREIDCAFFKRGFHFQLY